MTQEPETQEVKTDDHEETTELPTAQASGGRFGSVRQMAALGAAVVVAFFGGLLTARAFETEGGESVNTAFPAGDPGGGPGGGPSFGGDSGFSDHSHDQYEGESGSDDDHGSWSDEGENESESEGTAPAPLQSGQS